jgi:hypothetical protein
MKRSACPLALLDGPMTQPFDPMLSARWRRASAVRNSLRVKPSARAKPFSK